MCGICGIYNEKNLKTVTNMLESIRHRGPDSFTPALFGNHSLGECGLNIISSKKDSLPLIDEKDRIALLFNGEIYNYRELRDELTKDGYLFGSDTDSEVIISSYKKYGEDFVRHLKGMFAIAIIDKDKLLLTRDKFGIKPLYYYHKKDKVVFGSEIKSLLQHNDVPSELDGKSLDELVVFGYMLSKDRTLLKDIYQVPPGHTIIFKNNDMILKNYHEMPLAFYSNGQRADYDQLVARVKDCLLDTISLFHKHGKDPKGIYLSGGIDSSLMTILSKELTDTPLQTFTLYGTESERDYYYAKKVAKAVGAIHHEFKVTVEDYFEELPKFAYHYENIVAGGVFDIQGGMAFQILSRHISQFVKIAFTGEGADELFGGYYWIYTHPLGFADRIRKKAEELDKNSHIHDYIDTIFPQHEDEKVYRRNLFDTLIRAGLFNYHLWSVDRSCSAFGFEARPPYMYDNVVELALSIPIDFKTPDKKTTKMVLRDVSLPYLKKYGLEEIVDRRKYGMPASLDHIKNKIQDVIDGLVSDKDSHPFKKHLKTSTDVLMFDLFYYFLIDRRGKYPSDFSLFDFYRGGINEHMYH